MSGNAKENQFIFLMCLAVALFFAAAAYGQNAAIEARVTSVGGKATVFGGGRVAARLTRGATLASGDEIDTTGGGRVVIDLSDGSQVVVLPGSRVRIGDYRNAASLRELLQITLGRIRVKINHFRGKPNPYRIKSPTASIAVRGTEFIVTVEPLGETRVIVLEGEVEVASLKNPSKKLIAEPKRGVIVRPDSTINFFVSDALTKEVGERGGGGKQTGAANQHNADKNGNSRNATNVYERTVESIVEAGETALPSRFLAFPDAHLDSLENPAYAGAFTTGEGRIYFLPAINGATNAEDDLRARFGLSSPRPVDYSLVPEATVFVPVKHFRLVVGGSFGYVRSGLQSLAASGNFSLDSPPFPVGANGLRTVTAATSGNLFGVSLIVARRFGSRDQTSVGFSVERLSSRGDLSEIITQRDAVGLTLTEQISSHSSVNRTRLTFGVKHDFGSARIGAFYRRATSGGTEFDRFRSVNKAPQPTDFIRIKSDSSEIGFRLRSAFSSRFFYGAEASLIFADTSEDLRRTMIADTVEQSRARRFSLGFGLGYVLRPRVIFSFDAAGGLIGTKQRRTEILTGNTLETERQRARFLSFHAAVQTDIWKNLFASASLLSITQSRTTDSAFFSDRFGRVTDGDGVFAPNGRAKDFYTDIYSNYGVGWRFRRNFTFEYILTTDYGQTSPRHTFLLRYTFNFERE